MDSETEYVELLKYAVMIAIAAGIITTAVIIYYAGTDSYSALYLINYSNYIENGTVSLMYGVDRFGPAGASYDLIVYVDEAKIHTRSFTMEPGTGNGTVSFKLNRTEFPVKVQLVLNESGGSSYDVHFWLKGNR
jgi:hypothetical protein